MARKLTLREYEALSSLNSHPAWDRLLDWMKETLEQERQNNDAQLNDTLLRQAQGWCQCLSTLIEGATEAPKILRAQRRP